MNDDFVFRGKKCWTEFVVEEGPEGYEGIIIFMFGDFVDDDNDKYYYCCAYAGEFQLVTFKAYGEDNFKDADFTGEEMIQVLGYMTNWMNQNAT